jgi:hypothetical protein
MSDDLKIALITTAPLTITAVATLIVSLRNTQKLDVVHKLTNSNLNSVKRALVKANKKIDSLKK